MEMQQKGGWNLLAKFLKIVGPLPDFFDYWQHTIRQKKVESYKGFFKNLFESVSDKTDFLEIIEDKKSTEMSLTDFKTIYEKYCFTHHQREMNLEDKKSVAFLKKNFCFEI